AGGRAGIRGRAVRAGVRQRGHARGHGRLPRQAQAGVPGTLSMVHDVHGPEVPEAPDPRRLLELLRADDVDAALAAGLMAVDADAAGDLDPASRELLAQAQQRLRARSEERRVGKKGRIMESWDTDDTEKCNTVLCTHYCMSSIPE